MAVTINGTTGITTPDITSDSATIDSTTLVVDETNNRVGIGTASPSDELHIEDSDNTVQARLEATTGSVYLGVGGNAAYLNTTTSEGVRIRDTGTDLASFREDGRFQFNSGYGSVATAYGCRAWVNFDGTTNTGGNCDIRASGNVSTITDNGTGDYRVNFTTAMPNANYSTVTAGGELFNGNNNSIRLPVIGLQTTTDFRLNGRKSDNSLADPEIVCVAVFR